MKRHAIIGACAGLLLLCPALARAQSVNPASPSAANFTGTLAVANGGTGDTGTSWSTYTPTATCTTGSLTTYSATGRYKAIGKTLYMQASVTVTTNGTCAGGLTINLPNSLAAATGAIYVLSGRETATSGNAFTGTASSTNVLIERYDNTYGLATGSVVTVSGVVETN